MSRWPVALVAAVLVAAGGAVDSLAQPSGKLDGTWTAVSAERDGKPADELRGNRLTLAGNTFVIRREGKTLYRGTFTTDPARKPAHIDFRHTEGELNGKTWLGVYVLDGDSLQIADNAVDMAKPRPTRLATRPDSGYVLLAFKRM